MLTYLSIWKELISYIQIKKTKEWNADKRWSSR